MRGFGLRLGRSRDAVIAHGPNTANTARLVVFAMNPLYRADPEREWPAAATSAYWTDK